MECYLKYAILNTYLGISTTWHSGTVLSEHAIGSRVKLRIFTPYYSGEEIKGYLEVYHDGLGLLYAAVMANSHRQTSLL